MIGLAKRLEEVFVPGNSDAQSIPKNSPGLILLRKIRDDAHRFAITYQKQKRNKKVQKSIFDNIKGMGPKRVQSLLKSFDGVKNIAEEKASDIATKANVPLNIAKEILLLAKQFQTKQKIPQIGCFCFKKIFKKTRPIRGQFFCFFLNNISIIF